MCFERGWRASLLIVTCLISYRGSVAGEHNSQVDKFDGKITNTFGSTFEEWESQGKTLIVLSGYRKAEDTIQLRVATQAPVECGRGYMEVKTSAGVIHRIEATERDLRRCISRIPLSYVKNSFSLRIPMFRASPLIVTLDTSNLDASLLYE